MANAKIATILDKNSSCIYDIFSEYAFQQAVSQRLTEGRRENPMAGMNHNSFVKIMHLLGLTTSKLAQALYVSPSHVSRWKTGSRELKDTNAYFRQLVELFLSLNDAENKYRLERFLLPDFDPQQPPEDAGDSRLLLEEKLVQFLLQPGQPEAPVRAALPPTIQVLVGLENRIEALKQFFEYVLNLSPKPDIYIKEVLYASWCPQYLDWFSACHAYALRYMEAGGIIYYFSNLNNIDRATFYSIWQFTSHKNLYPGYSANLAEESPECAYYLAAGARSVTFYVPEDNSKSYITTVCTDPLMLTAQENYLEKKYQQRHHQIFINTMENRHLALNMVLLHRQKLTPLLFAGKFPSFLLLSPGSLRELLLENQVPEDNVKFCMKFHRTFREQLENPALQKTFFYYEEDLLDFAAAAEALDLALTGVAGKSVFVSWRVRRELLIRLLDACRNSPRTVRIASKGDTAVYDVLGESNTLWVKRNHWYLIFYPDYGSQTDLRLITDAIACTVRYDLYYQTLLNVPSDSSSIAAFLERALQVLDAAEQAAAALPEAQ